MSMACAKLVPGDALHCEPTGLLKQYGWLPGTWVKYVNAVRTFTKNAVASCERCGNTDFGCAFIPVGSSFLNNGFDSKFPNDNEYNGFWTADQTSQLIARNSNAEIGFDSNRQLSKLGTGICAAEITNTGAFKFYVYEKYNLAYRASDGVAGSTLNWTNYVGTFNALYISSRGLMTCEKEDPNSIVIPYIICDIGEDEVGKYINIVSD